VHGALVLDLLLHLRVQIGGVAELGLKRRALAERVPVRLLHHGFDVLVVAKGLLAIGEEIGDGRVRLRELF
jgi:hypothetical protein